MLEASTFTLLPNDQAAWYWAPPRKGSSSNHQVGNKIVSTSWRDARYSPGFWKIMSKQICIDSRPSSVSTTTSSSFGGTFRYISPNGCILWYLASTCPFGSNSTAVLKTYDFTLGHLASSAGRHATLSIISAARYSEFLFAIQLSRLLIG